MVAISAKEKKAIIGTYPRANIVRTVRQKSKRHRYYMAEERGPMELLRRLRGGNGRPSGKDTGNPRDRR